MSEPGAIPTSTPSTPPELESISRANVRGKSIITTRPRRLGELGRVPFDFARPYSFSEAVGRIKRNLSYFCASYASIMVMISSQVFLRLDQHTILSIAFMIVYLRWFFFLYSYRDEPLVLFNRTFEVRLVLIVLSVVTIVLSVAAIVDIGFTHVWFKLLVSLAIGALLVGLHAFFRVTDNLFLNEQEAADEGLLAVA